MNSEIRKVAFTSFSPMALRDKAMKLSRFCLFAYLLVFCLPLGAAAETQAYVLHRWSGGISVVDLSTNAVAGYIVPPRLGNWVSALAFTPDGKQAYAGADSFLWLIDTRTQSALLVQNAHEFLYGLNIVYGPAGVSDVVISPDGTMLYLTTDVGVFIEFSTATQSVSRSFKVTSALTNVALTPAGDRAYITSGTTNFLYVVDTATMSVLRTITVGSSPRGLAINPDGTRAYIAVTSCCTGDGSVAVVDTTTDSLIATIPIRGYPAHVAVSPDGSRVYVADDLFGSTPVIDATTNTLRPGDESIIQVFNPELHNPAIVLNPLDLAISADGSRIYFARNCGHDTCNNTSIPQGALSISDPNAPQSMAVLVPLPGGEPTRVYLVPPNTRVGTHIEISPVDAATGASPVILTFSNVTQAGDTTLAISNSGSPPPTGFKLGTPPTFYELSTTALFSGTIEVCINYTGVSFNKEATLKLFHFENGLWVNQTTSLDTANDIICATVTSLSPFAIFEEDNQPPVPHAGPDQTLECANPAGTPVTLDGTGSSDPDDNTLTYTWTGPFAEGGGTVTGVNPTVTLPLGSSTITLVVNDGTVDSAPDTVKIDVHIFVSGLQMPMVGLSPEGVPPLLPTRAFKRGSTIPLKLQLFCSGVVCTNATIAPPRIVGLFVSGGPIDLATIDLDAGDANDNGLDFRYSDPNWVYNLSTQGLSAGTYTITIQLPDGRNFNAGFVLR